MVELLTLEDDEAEKLLRLILKAVTQFPDYENMTLSDFVEDIAMSMDVTTDKADQYRRAIERILN
jgi:hypothetical protein